MGDGYFLTHYILISSVSIFEQSAGKMPVDLRYILLLDHT